MEVVIALAKCNHCGDDMITRSMPVIKRCVPKPVCQGIDTKSGVVNKYKARSACIYVSATPITPKQTRDHSGDSETHKEDKPDIPAVLPADHFILAEVRDIRNAGFAPWLHDHPANMGPQEATMGIVWIKVGIRIPVMCTVPTRPPLDRTFHSTCARSSKEVLQRSGGII
jgi:hypothetical protein